MENALLFLGFDVNILPSMSFYLLCFCFYFIFIIYIYIYIYIYISFVCTWFYLFEYAFVICELLIFYLPCRT